MGRNALTPTAAACSAGVAVVVLSSLAVWQELGRPAVDVAQLVEEVEQVWNMAAHRSLQVKKDEEKPLLSSFVGCFDGYAWAMALDGIKDVEKGKDGYLLEKLPTKGSSTHLVDRCAKGCHDLKYERFGIQGNAKCICGTAKPKTKLEIMPNGHQKGCRPCGTYSDFMKWNNTQTLKYTCGAENRTSVYRADYRNHEWNIRDYSSQVYKNAPAPPSLIQHAKVKYALTSVELQHLMALLDRDNDKKVSQHELIDVFDHIDNNALGVKDCAGNLFPTRWLGDGFCDQGDKGEDTTEAGKSPNFNCETFHCDNGDCKTPCNKSPGRDRVTVLVDGASDGQYGRIAQLGGVWLTRFYATAGQTYHFSTDDSSPDALNQTIEKGLAVSLTDKNGKAFPKGTFNLVGGKWTAPGTFGTGLGQAAKNNLHVGANITVNVEVRVPAADGKCDGGVTRGAKGLGRCYTLISDGKLYTHKQAVDGCRAKTQNKGSLVGLGRSSEERFIATNVLQDVGALSVWIGLSRVDKQSPGEYSWADKDKWLFKNFAKDEPKSGKSCVAIKHVPASKNSKQSDEWLSQTCCDNDQDKGKQCDQTNDKLKGYICEHNTGVMVEGATGTFKFTVQTKPAPKVVDPPVWRTALYYRHGQNLTRLNHSRIVPKRKDAACKNRLDQQQRNNTYCDNMVKKGFTCLKYFCEDEKKCDYAGFCDKTCTFGTCVDYSKGKHRPSPPPPAARGELTKRQNENTCKPGMCFDKYDCQDSVTTKNNTEHGAKDGQCAMLIKAGFTCQQYLCPECSYAGYCDKTCRSHFSTKDCNKTSSSG